MAYAEIKEAISGRSTIPFSFDYLDKDHVKVKIDGSEVPEADYTINGQEVDFDGTVPSGTNIHIYRDTNLDEPIAKFASGSAIRANDLNTLSDQVRFSAEERKARGLDSDGDTMTGELSMSGNKITNLGTPTDGTDAASKTYADGVRADVEAAKVAAETAQANAETAETNAETAQASAQAAETYVNSVYFGSHSSAPVDGNGDFINPFTNQVLTSSDNGAWYFDTTNNLSYIWNSTEYKEAIQPPLFPFNQNYLEDVPYTGHQIHTTVVNGLTRYHPTYIIGQDSQGNSLNIAYPEGATRALVEIDGVLAPPGAVRLIPEDDPTEVAINLVNSSGQDPTPPNLTTFTPSAGSGVPDDFTESLPQSMINSIVAGTADINLIVFGQSVFGAAGWQEATFSNGQINLISRTNPELNLTTADLRPTLSATGGSHSATSTFSNVGVTFNQVGTSNSYLANFTIPYAQPNSFSVDSTTFEPTLGFSDGTSVTANQSILGPVPTLQNATNGFTFSTASDAPGASLTRVGTTDTYDFSIRVPDFTAAANAVAYNASAGATIDYNTTSTNKYHINFDVPAGPPPTFTFNASTVGTNPGISFTPVSGSNTAYTVDAELPVVGFQVGTVNSVDPVAEGGTASVTPNLTGSTYTLDFDIPKGDFPTVTSGAVSIETGNGTGSVSIGSASTSSNRIFDFTLPRQIVQSTTITDGATTPAGADHQIAINTNTGAMFTWVNNAWVEDHNPVKPFEWKGRVDYYDTNDPNYSSGDTVLPTTGLTAGDTWTVNYIHTNGPANTTYYWNGTGWNNLGTFVGADGARGLKVIPIVAYANGSGTGIQRVSVLGGPTCIRHEKTTYVNGEPWDLKEGDLGVVFGSGEVYRFEMIDGDSSNSTYGQNERGDVRYDTPNYSNTYFGNVAVPASGTSGCTYTERTPVWVKIGTINTGMVFGALNETAPVVSNPTSNDEAASLPVTNAGETIGENGVFVQYDGYGVTYKKLVRSSSYANYVTSGWTWWYQWQNINGTHWTGRGTIGIGATLPAIQTGTNTDDTPPTNYNLGSLFILTSGNTGTFYNLGTYTHTNGHVAYQWVSTGTSMNLGGGLPSTAGIVTTDGTTASTINTDGIVTINSSTVSTHNSDGLVTMSGGAVSAVPSSTELSSTHFAAVTGIPLKEYTEELIDLSSVASPSVDKSGIFFDFGSLWASSSPSRTLNISLTDGEGAYYAANINVTTPNLAFSGQTINWISGTPTLQGNKVNHFEFWRFNSNTYGVYIGAS